MPASPGSRQQWFLEDGGPQRRINEFPTFYVLCKRRYSDGVGAGLQPLEQRGVIDDCRGPADSDPFGYAGILKDEGPLVCTLGPDRIPGHCCWYLWHACQDGGGYSSVRGMFWAHAHRLDHS